MVSWLQLLEESGMVPFVKTSSSTRAMSIKGPLLLRSTTVSFSTLFVTSSTPFCGDWKHKD